MNKVITSREAILTVGKEIVVSHGIQELSIREVAKRCGISVGSVYNYFDSKDDLVIATIESVWSEIMLGVTKSPNAGFSENIEELFKRVKKGGEKYPGFFTVHSMSSVDINRDMGRDVMNSYFLHLKKAMRLSLDTDKRVRADAFDKGFKKSEFIDFVFSSLLSLLMSGQQSCEMLTEIIRRTVYR